MKLKLRLSELPVSSVPDTAAHNHMLSSSTTKQLRKEQKQARNTESQSCSDSLTAELWCVFFSGELTPTDLHCTNRPHFTSKLCGQSAFSSPLEEHDKSSGGYSCSRAFSG